MKSRALESPKTCLTEQVLANKLEELYILGNSRSGNLENSEQFGKPRNPETQNLENLETQILGNLRHSALRKLGAKEAQLNPRKTHGTSKILRTQCAEKE